MIEKGYLISLQKTEMVSILKKVYMVTLIRRWRWASFVVAGLVLLNGGTARSYAQATSGCPPESSFEYPLWNDGASWKQFNGYSSIQLADIDGDGQDELLGNGPTGVEIWHWEPHGQAWVQMNIATPTIARTDTLMTADVDGDGQAEIIQVTPNLGASPVVNVWHFDGNANPQVPAGPLVWRLEPQLRLTLTPSVGSNATPLVPIIKFAPVVKGAGKQQQLVSMAIRVTPGLVYYTPFVYQVNAGQTGWTAVVQGPITNGGGTFTNSSPGTMQIGDVTGDGLADIAVLEGSGTFLIFTQQAPTAGGQVSFAAGQQLTVPKAVTVYSFTLADTLGAGYDQIYVADFYSDAQNTYRPGNYYLEGYQFSAQGLQGITATPTIPTAAMEANYPAVYRTLQSARTGLNSAHPNAQTILMQGANGIQEYQAQYLGELLTTSASPFVTFSRFGDDPSHYTTIQTGSVFAYTSAQTPVQYSETILVARDANGIHTLVPTAAHTICGSTLPGFDLPQKALAGQYYYFPAFLSSGEAQAYAYFNTLNNVRDLRTAYSNSYSNDNTYLTTVSGATYPSNYPGPGPTAFTSSDFTAVKNQLIAELKAVNNVIPYFGTSPTNGIISGDLQYINTQETAALTTALTALNLPPDAAPANGLQVANIGTQIVTTIFGFIGNAGDPVASQASEAFCALGDIISDVQSAESSPGGTLTQQGLALEAALSASYADQQTANATTLQKVLQNWDLLSQLYQQTQSANVTSLQTDAANRAAVNTYAISAWQQLVPSVWGVVGYSCFSGEQILPSGYQPYFIDGIDKNSKDLYWCDDLDPYPAYVVFADLPSGTNDPFSRPTPVPAAAIQQLLDLGVNWYDVLGGRNGWPQLPLNLSKWFPSGFTPTIPATNPYYRPPAYPPPPSVGGPVSIVVSGGQASGASQAQCGYNTPPDIFQQSAPVNSVFPNAISVSVLDANNVGVPNATVQISGVGLSPATSTIVTDANGLATTYLLANNIIQGPYNVIFKLVSPALVSGYPSCGVTQTYILQNTAPFVGTKPVNPDMQAVVRVTSKTAVFTTDRLWNVLITDPTGTAKGGTVNGQLTLTRGSPSCHPTLVAAGGLTPTATPGEFASELGWDFSSCKGLNLFTLTVSGTFSIQMDDGVFYDASYSTSTNNQTP